MAGVIDPDYTGIVGVVLVNLGDAPFEISVGDRIAQLIFERFESSNPVLHALFENTTDDGDDNDDGDNGDGARTDMTRGAAGFGSSGVQ